MIDDDSSPEDEQDSLLRRWSRRKQRVRAAAEAEDPQDHSERSDSHTAEPADEPVAEAAELELPRIEDLDENSDYSPFLNPEVSEDLRRIALRKLFRSAVFNIRDGLDDYDEDFTVYEPLGDIRTARMDYEMRRKAERAKEQLAEATGSDEPAAALEETAEPSAQEEPEAPQPEHQELEPSVAGTQPREQTLAPNPCEPAS